MKVQLGKLKHITAALLDMLLADIFKTANPGASFISLDADWLNPQKQK